MTTPAATQPHRAARIRVDGTVQGVGFRPFVYRLARELRLDGCVRNDERGVVIDVGGNQAALASFVERLAAEAPPLAAVERVDSAPLSRAPGPGFEIVASDRGGEPRALVSPDTATCDDCLRELVDPGDRRYRYPFINCTNCGPRFTIVRAVPYDRPFTTMAGFEMCARCRAEYHDPLNRRFHAQPNACPDCGPTARLVGRDGEPVSLEGARDALEAAARAIENGLILAVKGVGGFHLACRADDERAVAALRARKQREDKPFALMAPSVEAAARLVELTAPATALLTSAARPIVLAPRLAGAAVAASVAPRSQDLGVMLPYSPLHHLLLRGEPLVMTSGNVSDEPIAYRDDDALERLAAIADLFLVHDRPIHMRTDDSVVRIALRDRPLPIRRSRGYVPASAALPMDRARHVLACGAELKSTLCVAKDRRAWVSHHIGDLKNWDTLRSFREGVAHFERLFAVEPELVAHDLHPDYLSTAYALERDGVEHVGVQHHHAHLAACLAEHGERGPAVAAIYDGSGYGSDGCVWGGEVLVGDLSAFERAGHLRPVRLPGGDAAVREPWRMACAWLTDAGAGGDVPPALAGRVTERRWRQVYGLVRSGSASPSTTSAGRLFDAVAAICGIRSEVTYEGQAAVELEAACDARERGRYPLDASLDARETILAAAGDIAGGVAPGVVAARFHNGLAAATVEACAAAAARHGVELAVLSGGVFQNRRLLDATAAGLRRAGLRVLIPERLPPNDGGISYGQAAVACAG